MHGIEGVTSLAGAVKQPCLGPVKRVTCIGLNFAAKGSTSLFFMRQRDVQYALTIKQRAYHGFS